MSATNVIRLDATESTNADAMRLAREGGDAPFWVIAREQRGGRGRRGRAWHSPPGNLYASLLLIEPCPAETAPQLGFVAGVALVEAIDAVLGAPQVALKWPNDVLAGDAKLSGILLEASRLPDGRLACVAGIGVNCRSHPADLPYAANHLAAVAGRDVAPNDLFDALAPAMERALALWGGGRDFAAIRAAWLDRAARLGQPVSTTLGGRAVTGAFETIDASGRLVMRVESGERLTIDAGDVLFASARVPA